ncbi:MAG: type II secretion system protein [Phycisphaerae bacterium]|jgi:prepilin-type N-terminal cleavage/methylation domain-containing protein|nr:type II secretion system protein [Phycisphaerae bacterium]MBT5382219.1 type II secretion system protein [Phycisphaerae bacterium]MBT5584527.1 type II secretion system protein [Phycisphaerae bacterium]
MNRRGYTLIELMVVLAIIGVLLAMAGGGLVLARRAAIQTTQSNNLRQLGLAWVQYNTASRGRFVPGWVSRQAQRDRRMVLAYPDTVLIPPAPFFSENEPNIAGPWTWRIIPYLSNDIATIISHHDEDLLPILDYEQYGEQIAFHPAFGYNGWYVGGHLTIPADAGRTVMSFSAARLGDRTKDNLVAESLGRMKNPSKIIVFMPGAIMSEPGGHMIADATPPSWFEVTPPFLADQEMWRVASPTDVDTFAENVAVPRLGHGMDLPVFHADGSIDTHTLNTLRNQNMWIDAARIVEGTPAEEFTHEAE